MILKRLIDYLKPHMNRFLLSLFCMAIFSAITGATMWIVKNMVDKIFIARDTKMLYILTAMIPVAFFLKGIAGYGQNYLMYYITQNIIKTLRNELYEKLITLSHSFYVKNSTSKLMARVTNDVQVLSNALFRVPPSIIRDGLTVIFMIGIIFYLNWRFATLSLIIFPVASIPLSGFARKMRNASREGQKQMAEVYESLQETLSGINVIKAFIKEDDEIKRFHKENEDFYQTQQKFIRVDARSSPIMEFIGAVAVAFVLWFGGMDVINGVWTPGSFFAFLTAAFSIYQPLKNFASTNSLIQQAIAGAERIFEILDEKPTIVDNDGAVTLQPFKASIVYDNVTFHYPEKENVLSKINLSINQGDIIAVVGPSGSGKTTLANLLLRFYDVDEGRVLIDDKDIRDVTLQSLRTQIGIVTQEVILFNETVNFNIAYGKKEAAFEEIVSAAKAANAHKFIEQLSQGYNSMIGERGVRLSGGEKQRLSIARAILKNPPILILDEATSSLDAESEKLVQEAIERLMQHRTVFLIAHRLATVKKANRIIVLDKGKIVEQGTHEQLLGNEEGIYKRLHYLQILD
ncbi:MAG: ABC transporter ATP-binding protein/permease [Elusimicrobia bacterium]|nr:ABC transporter ATP-binding protein/permease [Candidatus Liberimonas magnetica]